MKKKVLVAIAALVLALTALCLVGCSAVSVSDVNGYYVNVEISGSEADVQVLYAKDGSFVLDDFTLSVDGRSAAVITEEVRASYELTGAYVGAKDNERKMGEYTYQDNAFIVRRMALTYDDGGKEFCYISKSGDTFELSPTIPVVLLYCVMGFAVTLIVLVFLMLVIKLLSLAVDKARELKESKKKQETALEVAPEVAAPVLAKGSAGEIKLVGVEEKDAAMIMAILADQLQVPLNSLRFVSITDITDAEVEK